MRVSNKLFKLLSICKESSCIPLQNKNQKSQPKHHHHHLNQCLFPSQIPFNLVHLSRSHELMYLGSKSLSPKNLLAASVANLIISDLDLFSLTPYIKSTIKARNNYLWTKNSLGFQVQLMSAVTTQDHP